MKMKLSFLASLAVGSLGLTLVVASGLMHIGQARYPGAARAANVRLDISAIHHGYLGWQELYTTKDAMPDVWRWYTRVLAMELEEGTRSEDHCVKLARVQRFITIGRTIGVSVCSVCDGTLVSVYQTIHLSP